MGKSAMVLLRLLGRSGGGGNGDGDGFVGVIVLWHASGVWSVAEL